MKQSIARVLRNLANKFDSTTEIGRIREFVTGGDFVGMSFDFRREPTETVSKVQEVGKQGGERLVRAGQGPTWPNWAGCIYVAQPPWWRRLLRRLGR